MDIGLVISIILALVGIAITVVIWIGSTRSVRVQEAQAGPASLLRSVDQDAYERAKKIYEGAIDQLESEVVRLNGEKRDLQAEVTRLNLQATRPHTEPIKTSDIQFRPEDIEAQEEEK